MAGINKLILEIKDGELGIAEMAIITKHLNKRFKIVLFDNSNPSDKRSSMLNNNLNNFAKNVCDYFDNPIELVHAIGIDDVIYNLSNTLDLTRRMPEALVSEIGENWKIIKFDEKRPWDHKQDIWQYVVCPNFLKPSDDQTNQTIDASGYYYKYQCGNCRTCKAIKRFIDLHDCID